MVVKKFENQYQSLPEWFRWVLTFILTPLVTISAGFCYVIFVMPTATRAGGYQIIIHAFHPAVVSVFTLWVLYFLVPRAKLVFVWSGFILRSLVPVLLVIGAALKLAGLDAFQQITLDYHWLKEFLGEIFTFTVSLLVIVHLKEQK